MSCSIATLPLDLQVMIMTRVPDTQTLASLLKAIPPLCPTFSSVREKILNKVLMNTYGAEIFPEAWAAAKVMVLPQKDLSRDERLGFLKYYHRCRKLTKFPEIDLRTLIPMCQLHRALDYHVKRFSESAFQFIRSCAEGLLEEEAHHQAVQTQITSTLSFTEQVRLRRAFLRFQIYSRLLRNVNPPDEEKGALVAQRMPSWEAEEIASVYRYITQSIQQTFDLAGEDFLSAYTIEAELANVVGGVVDLQEGAIRSSQIDPADSNAVGQPQATAFQQRLTDQYEIRLKGDILEKPIINAVGLGDDLYQARLKAHMLVSGLCFLRRLFESTGEARLALVSAKDDFSHFLQPPSMNLLFDYTLTAIWNYPKDSATRDPNDPEPSQQSTLTWRWAHEEEASSDWRTGMFHSLRTWGYIFWDVNRMQASGILEQRYVIWRDA